MQNAINHPPFTIQIVEMLSRISSLFSCIEHCHILIYNFYASSQFIYVLNSNVWYLNFARPFFVRPQKHRLLPFNTSEIENVNRDSFDVNAFCFDACYCIVRTDASKEERVHSKWKRWMDGTRQFRTNSNSANHVPLILFGRHKYSI